MKPLRLHPIGYKHHTRLNVLTQWSQVAFDVVRKATSDINARLRPARSIVKDVKVVATTSQKCVTYQEGLVEGVRIEAEAAVEEEIIVGTGKGVKAGVAKTVEGKLQADITLKAEIPKVGIDTEKGLVQCPMMPQGMRSQIGLITLKMNLDQGILRKNATE